MGMPANILVNAGASYGSGQAPMSNYPQTPGVASGSDVSIGASGSIIDGTPLRVVSFVALAIFGLVLFQWGKYKFHVTSG